MENFIRAAAALAAGGELLGPIPELEPADGGEVG